MKTFEVFRSIRGDLQPLDDGPNGYLCSEGELIVFRTYTLELPRVHFCGEVLTHKSLRQHDQHFVGEFERVIDMWAGRTVFTLDGGPAPERLQLDIGPHEKKLSINEWDGLIQELCKISDTLPWGLSPGAAAGLMTPDALANVHPAIIQHQLPAFLRLLRQFRADPPTHTLRVRTVRPLDTSRKSDLRTMRWLSRRPMELVGVRGHALEDQPPNPRALADQPETVASLDHPITRYFAYLLERIRGRLTITATNLRESAGHGVPDPAATAFACQLAHIVEQAETEIEVAQHAPLFRRVQPEALTDSVLQSLPDHPLYSALHRAGRRLTNPGLAYAPGQSVYSSLKHSYDLFELLVLYRLAAEISAGLGPDWHPIYRASIDRLPREDRPADSSIWSWRGPDQQELELHYQVRFASAAAPPDLRLFASLSAQGVPDYILIYRRGHATVFWIVLDAKYRSGRQSIHDALGDIHRYRDSLRVSGRAADAAYIIVPRLQENANLYSSGAYLDAHQVGAISVYEDGWMQPIWQWFQLAKEKAQRACSI